MNFNLSLGYEIVEWAIYIEVILIVVLVLATYLFKWISVMQAKRRARNAAKIEEHLTSLVNENKPYNRKAFRRRWRKSRVLLPVFFKLDKQYANNPNWQRVRQDLLVNLILPIARRKARSVFWLNRYYATEVFNMICMPEDEKRIVRLTSDRVPLVYIHSIGAAIKCGSEKAINNVLTRMSKMSWLAQNTSLDAFRNAPPTVSTFIQNRLAKEKNSNVRAACYKILALLPPIEDFNIPHSDLHSDNMQLRIASAKYFVTLKRKDTIPVLTSYLRDKDWQLRLTALQKLGELQAKEAIPSIKECLQDSNWWVRVNAAEILRSFGKEGQQILSNDAPDLAELPEESLTHMAHSNW